MNVGDVTLNDVWLTLGNHTAFVWNFHTAKWHIYDFFPLFK